MFATITVLNHSVNGVWGEIVSLPYEFLAEVAVVDDSVGRGGPGRENGIELVVLLAMGRQVVSGPHNFDSSCMELSNQGCRGIEVKVKSVNEVEVKDVGVNELERRGELVALANRHEEHGATHGATQVLNVGMFVGRHPDRQGRSGPASPTTSRHRV